MMVLSSMPRVKREHALGDADGEAGGCAGEVAFESHLFLRFEKTLSITRRVEASVLLARSLGRLVCLLSHGLASGT